MRYQATHERAVYRALNELRTITAQRIKQQIGFVSQKRGETFESRTPSAPTKPQNKRLLALSPTGMLFATKYSPPEYATIKKIKSRLR
jgi:hypothetical protein